MEEKTENPPEISCAGEEKCFRKQSKWFTITKTRDVVVESNIILIIMSTNVTKPQEIVALMGCIWYILDKG